MQCRLCGSDSIQLAESNVKDFEYESATGINYYGCAQCGLLAIDPIPDSHTLERAYPPAYHAYQEHHSVVARLLKDRFWKKKASRYSRYLTEDSNVLELGCSFGDLLISLTKQGILSVQGVDFNCNAVQKARSRGLSVKQGEIDTIEPPKDHFDMIVMENFIEHTYDPVSTLHRCRQLLKPGGYVAGETPNVDAWDRTLFRRHWGGYHAPRHIFLFSARNLKLLAERTGFHVVRISNLLQPAHWALSIQNRLQDSVLKTRLRNGRSFYFGPLVVAAIPVNVAQMLVSRTSSVEFVFQKGL